jgi:hypothetical protein
VVRRVTESPVCETLVGCLVSKQEDDEIILQILYAIFQILLTEDGQNVLLHSTRKQIG